jgi:hypothetical protein
LFMIVENFEEIIPRPLNTEKEKQIGVSYSMSWGGGTQGLRENLTFNSCTGTTYQQDPELFPDTVLSGTSLSQLERVFYWKNTLVELLMVPFQNLDFMRNH